MRPTRKELADAVSRTFRYPERLLEAPASELRTLVESATGSGSSVRSDCSKRLADEGSGRGHLARGGCHLRIGVAASSIVPRGSRQLARGRLPATFTGVDAGVVGAAAPPDPPSMTALPPAEAPWLTSPSSRRAAFTSHPHPRGLQLQVVDRAVVRAEAWPASSRTAVRSALTSWTTCSRRSDRSHRAVSKIVGRPRRLERHRTPASARVTISAGERPTRAAIRAPRRRPEQPRRTCTGTSPDGGRVPSGSGFAVGQIRARSRRPAGG